MGTRFFYGFLLVAAVVGVLAIDHYANETYGLFFLSAVVVSVGVIELDRLLKFRGLPVDRALLLLLNLCTLAYVQFLAEPPRLGALALAWSVDSPHYWFAVLPQYRQLTLLLPLPALLICCFQGLRSRDVPQLSARILVNTGSYIYLIYTVAVILWLRRIPGGGEWLLYFLAATSRVGDIGAYLMGRAVGRHKLIPHLSPGKTIEGAFFGLTFSAAAGAGIIYWAHSADALKAVFPEWWYGGILGAFMGIAAQCGDLVKSALKRAAGVKDSGQLVPAFGGVLDLIDNFMLTGPLLVILLALWPV